MDWVPETRKVFGSAGGKMGLVEQGFSSTFAKILAKNEEKPCFDLP